VEGGTITGVTITTATIGTLGGTALNANNVDITNIDVDGGTIDGTTITQDDGSFTLRDETNTTATAVFVMDNVTAGQQSLIEIPDADGTIMLSSGALTANRTTITNGSGVVTTSTVTSTELEVLNAVTGGTASINKALITDGSNDISNINILAADRINVNSVQIDGSTVSTTANGLNLVGAAGVSVSADGNPVMISTTTTGSIQLDGIGGVDLNSTGGAINIGNDGDANAINLGTGAAARTISVGNVTGATAVNLDAGTGGISLDAGNASNLTTTAGAITIDAQASSVAIDGNSGVTIDASASGNVTVTASAAAGGIDIDAGATSGTVNIDAGGAIGIGTNGSDAGAINIGTSTGGRTITLGNSTVDSNVVLNGDEANTVSTTATVNGGLTVARFNETVSGANYPIAVANRSFIAITDSGATTGITLNAGNTAGQVLVLLAANITGTMTLSDFGTTRLSGNWAPTTSDTITLIWDGTNWNELHRSVN
ncbi:MAG: hypothetical protein ABJG78_09570, partial [Cyclobacteriaceae bacterium]